MQHSSSGSVRAKPPSIMLDLRLLEAVHGVMVLAVTKARRDGHGIAVEFATSRTYS